MALTNRNDDTRTQTIATVQNLKKIVTVDDYPMAISEIVTTKKKFQVS